MADPIGPTAQRLVDRAEILRAGIAVPVDDGAEREREAQRWATRVKEENQRAFERACPLRFADAAMDDVPDAHRDDLMEWASDPWGRNLLLTGPVGCGKTHAAIATLRHALDLADKLLQPEITSVVGLLDELRASFGPQGHPSGPPYGRPDPFERACEVDLLLLDDVGAERVNDWTGDRLAAVIDRRWLDMRPVISTSNLEVGRDGDLVEALGDRAYSRLVGTGTVVIRMSGDDMRRTAHKSRPVRRPETMHERKARRPGTAPADLNGYVER